MVLIIDIYSRKVLNWSISKTMTIEWSTPVYQDNIDEFNCSEILNTDQVSEFKKSSFHKNIPQKQNQNINKRK